MQFGGIRPDEMGEDFSLLAARQIGAGARRSQVELVGVGYELGHRSDLSRRHHTTPEPAAQDKIRIDAAVVPPDELSSPQQETSIAPAKRLNGADGDGAEEEIVQELLSRGEERDEQDERGQDRDENQKPSACSSASA